MKTVSSNRYRSPDTAKKHLRYWLLVFFIGISLPVYFLLHKVYSQLENETWYSQRNQAEIMVERIERQLLDKLQPEQSRPIAEYSFFNVLENPLLQSTTVNFSPLSELPPKTDLPGLIGYFQVDPDGSFHSPALPELTTDLKSGLSADALAMRIALKDKLRSLLAFNQPEKVQGSLRADKKSVKHKEDNTANQEALIQTKRFDNNFESDEREKTAEFGKTVTIKLSEKTYNPAPARQKNQVLSEEKLRQLNIETGLWKQKRRQNEAGDYIPKQVQDNYPQQARKETVKIPDQSLASALFKSSRTTESTDDSAQPGLKVDNERPITSPAQANTKHKKSEHTASKPQLPVNILSFESEVSPLQLITLDGRYLCFYRNAWNGKSRYIQGFIVDQHFLQDIIQPILDTPEGLPLSSLLIVDKGNVLQLFKVMDVNSELLLFRRTLMSPFIQMEVIVNTGSFAAGSGKRVLDMISVALAFIIITGFVLFYRLAAGQIELAKQQRNFISSVSHELKTPLTSIRMYSEMLRSDWVSSDTQKKGYYDYIYFESERLSRLISNVLQLARLDNHHKRNKLASVSTKELLQQVQAKVSAQVEAANYQLTLIAPTDEPADVKVNVDEDAFFQIMINLVDNAIKFSRQSDHNTIDIGYRINNNGKDLVFYVRDYGPGVEKEQMKKIFRLFYRAGDELTRTQPGTGIGLALIVQLAKSMAASVDLVNRSPGAEFQVKF